MELRHLRYFVAVAEELHFGHAASRLHTSQPSLSRQIQNLEREFKVELFVRTMRRVELTPAGRRFFEEARGILAAAERAAGLARKTAREASGKLVVGISPDTDWLPFARRSASSRSRLPRLKSSRISPRTLRSRPSAKDGWTSDSSAFPWRAKAWSPKRRAGCDSSTGRSVA